AGEAYAMAAEALGAAKVWDLAEKAFTTAQRFGEAAHAVEQRAELADAKQKAPLFARAAELLLQAGDSAGAIASLQRAADIDPMNAGYAQTLAEQYRSEAREHDLVTFLLTRAAKLTDKPRRIASRRGAAEVQRALGDKDGARESLLLLLTDGDDADALLLLV